MVSAQGVKPKGALKCKAWNLWAVYKQLPLSDLSFELDSHFVIYKLENGTNKFTNRKCCPSEALWRVGVKSLQLAWTDCFHNYPSTSGAACTRHTEFVISMFFKILGWDLSVMKGAILGVAVIGNTEKRKCEALSDIDAALKAGALALAQ